MPLGNPLTEPNLTEFNIQTQLKLTKFATVEQDPEQSFKNNWFFKLVISSSEMTTSGIPSRDHLSNERTVLAYIRTGLNLVLYALIILQLAKYIVIAPLKEYSDQNNQALVMDDDIYNDMKHLLDTVNRFTKPLGILIFCMSIFTLLVGAFRYIRQQHYICHGRNNYESGALLNFMIFIGILPILVLAFVYTYNL